MIIIYRKQYRDLGGCFSFGGNYTAGALSDIIVSLISDNKPCGYVFVGSGVSGLPSGYSGFVEYQSNSATTNAIPIVLRTQNKYPVYGRITLSTKAIEWNSDLENSVRFVNDVKNNFWVWLNVENRTLYIYDGPAQSTGANIIGTLKLT